MDKRLVAGVLALLGLSAILGACSGGAGSTAQTGGGSPTEAAGAPGPTEGAGGAGASTGAGGGGGANGFEGTLASSGVYSANWTVSPDAEPNPINGIVNPTLTSDKGTFGNIKVETDGRVAFGSAATELSGSYDGTGAKVTLDATGQFVCAFTIDNDLKGSNDGAILHMKGGLTVHWHPEGIGDLSCP